LLHNNSNVDIIVYDIISLWCLYFYFASADMLLHSTVSFRLFIY